VRVRNLFLGLAAIGAMVAGAVLPTTASASTSATAKIGEVDYKMLPGSTITKTASFKLEIVAGPGTTNVASVDVYRIRRKSAGTVFLGHFSGTSATDTVMQSWNRQNNWAEYEMIPYNSAGVAGASVIGNQFYPLDYEYFGFQIDSGTCWSPDYTSKAFDGAMEHSTCAGASAEISDEDAYNDGIVVGTGPTGGTGTVEDAVNGGGFSVVGTINFYSAQPGFNKILFKFGTHTDQVNDFLIVMRAGNQGAGGGYDMFLNALVDIYP
jgi:hypothetical protein